ncbi:MAG: hypothetical protein ACYC3F_05540 [Gemmatimonadaceae bacterium]
MSTTDWAAWIGASIAVATLAWTVYRDVWPRDRLHTQLDRLGVFGASAAVQQAVRLDALYRDLTGGQPSSSASLLFTLVPRLREELGALTRADLPRWIELAVPAGAFRYDPPQELVLPWVDRLEALVSLWLPLVLTNTGRQVGHVANVVLELRDARDPDKRWLYQAEAELDATRMIRRHLVEVEADRLQTAFVGVAVPPDQTTRVDLLMAPLRWHRDRSTVIQPPGAGTFEVRATGFRPGGTRRAFRTDWAEVRILEREVIASLLGGDVLINLSADTALDAMNPPLADRPQTD